jgi:formate-dependent nitrite reductase membrane component NrfD
MRFPYAFLRPQESWISIGAWLLTLFFILAAFQWLKQFFNRDKQQSIETQQSGWIWGLGIILALLTAIYTGILLGVVRAIPFWNTAILPVLFLISALSTGIGAVLLVAVGLKKSREAVQLNPAGFHFLAKVDGILVLLEIMCLTFYFIIIAKAGAAASASTHMIISGSLAAAFWLGVVVIGLLIPFILEFKTFKATAAKLNVAQTAITGICLLIGGLALRYIILAAGIYEAGFPFI